jgi:D-aminopeptidase
MVVLMAMAVAVPPVVVVVATDPAAMRDQREVVCMAVIPACRKGLSEVATVSNPPRGAERMWASARGWANKMSRILPLEDRANLSSVTEVVSSLQIR